MKARILIVDDEEDIRSLIQGILEDEGYETVLAANVDEAAREISSSAPDLAILDIWLDGNAEGGMKILGALRKAYSHVPVLMISGHGTIETAVAAIKQGAYDFIEKPFKSERLLLLIDRALETLRLRRENMSLREKTNGPADFVGDSPVISSVRQLISRVAATNSRVLITGEPGTGKDLAARILHRMSRRANAPFVVLNCAVMRSERFETELFGEEGGAPGLLEQAHGGTLFLDEVSDMPPEIQGKIVRVLQDQPFFRVGGTQPVEVDVRIVASSNRNLQLAMEEGRFRQDLFYRLNVVPVAMPPLRDRVQDVPVLAAYFSTLLACGSGLPEAKFSQGAIAAMQVCDWPGNVRQLRNLVEWVMIMHGGTEEPIRADQLPPEINATPDDQAGRADGRDPMTLPLREARELFERDYLISQIARFGGNISRTAQFVGMERSALHRKLKLLGVISEDRQEQQPAPAASSFSSPQSALIGAGGAGTMPPSSVPASSASIASSMNTQGSGGNAQTSVFSLRSSKTG